MGGGASVLRDETEVYDDGLVASVRVLAVPESERFPEGVEYALHYGEAGAEHPIIRFDTHHGVHERHDGAETTVISFPGLGELYRTWRKALPPDRRRHW